MKHRFIAQLKQLFEQQADRYAVHAQGKTLLEQMAKSTDFLYDIIRYNLTNAEFLKRERAYPTLSLSIEENSDFTFVVNIFPALPSRQTDLSFQSIHHHGSLLLSTVGVIGSGYTSILFKKGYDIDYVSQRAYMQIEKEYQNENGKVEFVDANQPHIVFYPKQISATYALWSHNKRSVKEQLKKIGLINRLKKPLAKLINTFGLSKTFWVNRIEYFDFYPDNKQLFGLKDRLAYQQKGSNENFIQNIFHFIQQTGFNDMDFLIKLKQSPAVTPTVIKYIDKLLSGERIEDQFFEGHLNVPKVNVSYREVVAATRG